MKICLKYGSTAAADAPTRRSSVGRSRQPSSVCPSSWTIFSISASIVARAEGSRGRKTHPAPYSPAGGSVDAEPARFLAKERVRHLDQDAGAVAGVDLAAARTAMQQVDEHLERLPDDGVRAHAFDVDDEADATGVVLVARIVEALRGRAAGIAIHKEELVIRYPEP